MADDEAQMISRRMAELRRDLITDVLQVRQGARVMTDWKFYVGRFPWVALGVAALAGFMAVPRKKAVISPDQEALAELVRKKHLRLNVDHKQEKPGLISAIVATAASVAAKSAMGYFSERMRSVAEQKAHQRSEVEASAASIH
jgi:hypothetical protein